MDTYYRKKISDLEDQIKYLSYQEDDYLASYEKVIEYVLQKLNELKECVLDKGFTNQEHEIHFFKKIKPLFLSKLIYYNSIYKIEMKKPHGGSDILKEYLSLELSKIKRYFDNNLDFYKYYRTNSKYLDDKYFVRGNHDIKLSLDTYYFEADQRFSTSHDYKIAKIIAYDLVQIYLEDQLHNTNQVDRLTPALLNWTGSKTALTELIYALYSRRVFDNGNTDIKHIAKYFEAVFNIDLGDFYHTYLELKNRKINPTKFIDSLREGLIQKIEEEDEH